VYALFGSGGGSSPALLTVVKNTPHPDKVSFLDGVKSSLGDVKSSRVTLRARWVTLRARWATLRARG
jgi:hypothetical protein